MACKSAFIWKPVRTMSKKNVINDLKKKSPKFDCSAAALLQIVLFANKFSSSKFQPTVSRCKIKNLAPTRVALTHCIFDE